MLITCAMLPLPCMRQGPRQPEWLRMGSLLVLARANDRLSAAIGRTVGWLIRAAILVSATNPVVHKIFSVSSNSFLEVRWYLYGAAFLLAAAQDTVGQLFGPVRGALAYAVIFVGALLAATTRVLERVRQKWTPVLSPDTRKNKRLESVWRFCHRQTGSSPWHPRPGRRHPRTGQCRPHRGSCRFAPRSGPY